MPKHPQDAVTEQQRLQSLQKIPKLTLSQCIQRLENLQTHFLHIGSVDELRDAVVEAGTIVAQIVYYRLGNYLSVIPAGANRQMLEYFAGYCLLHIPKSGGLDVLPWKGILFTEKRRRYYREQFWLEIAECSDQTRNVLNGSIGPVMFHFKGDFKQQAKRYNLLVSEQIANLLTGQTIVSADASSSSSSEPTKKRFTPGELVDELDKLLTKASQYYTAEQVWKHLLEHNPGKTIGLTAIKNHPKWKEHNREWGENRAARNTSRQAAKAVSDKLIAQQERRQQQTRHRGVDRIADGD